MLRAASFRASEVTVHQQSASLPSPPPGYLACHRAIYEGSFRRRVPSRSKNGPLRLEDPSFLPGAQGRQNLWLAVVHLALYPALITCAALDLYFVRARTMTSCSLLACQLLQASYKPRSKHDLKILLQTKRKSPGSQSLPAHWLTGCSNGRVEPRKPKRLSRRRSVRPSVAGMNPAALTHFQIRTDFIRWRRDLSAT